MRDSLALMAVLPWKLLTWTNEHGRYQKAPRDDRELGSHLQKYIIPGSDGIGVRLDMEIIAVSLIINFIKDFSMFRGKGGAT